MNLMNFTKRWSVRTALVLGAAAPALGQDVITQEQLDALESSSSRLSDRAIPLQYDLVPSRPQPLFEAGNPYQGTGSFEHNLFLPGGAVFQPSLLVWGTYRSAFNGTVDEEGRRNVSEWANRLDLFGEYRLSGTERFVVGMRPLDKDGAFFGHNFRNGRGQSDINGNIETLFFEGDFGELFPSLDPQDMYALDYGFSIGRQPLFFQDGVMLNDVVDVFGVTRNSKRFWGFSNVRMTGLLGWNEINRGGGSERDDATLFGFMFEADNHERTIEADTVYTTGDRDSDGLYLGFASTQRYKGHNTTLRANLSMDMDDEGSPQVDDGLLISAEISKTLHHSDDLLYFNSFLGIDDYRSAAQGPASPGPLARTGILFAGSGIGTTGVPLGGASDDSLAVAAGGQHFLQGGRENIILEVGARYNYDVERSAIAGGGRWQRAWGQHAVFAADAYTGWDDSGGANGGFDGGFVGGRIELLFKF